MAVTKTVDYRANVRVVAQHDGGCTGRWAAVTKQRLASGLHRRVRIRAGGDGGSGGGSRRGGRERTAASVECGVRDGSVGCPGTGVAGGQGSVLPVGVAASFHRLSAPNPGVALVASSSGGWSVGLQLGMLGDAVEGWPSCDDALAG